MPHKSPHIDFPGQPLLGNANRLLNDALNFMSEMSNTGKKVVSFKIGRETCYLYNHPDLIERVYRSKQKNYERSDYYDRLKPFLGEGLLTLEGPKWRQQRSVAQPSFKGSCLKEMTDQMALSADQNVKALINNATNNKHPVDMIEFSLSITLDIALRTMFTTQLKEGVLSKLYDAMTVALREMEKKLWSALPLPMWLPTKRHRRYKRAVGYIDELVLDLINERVKRPRGETNDLLEAIIQGEIDLNGKNNIDQQSLLDQVKLILVASHETVTSSISWSLLCLSKHPEWHTKLKTEAETVLGDNLAGFDDIANLPLSKAFFEEVLRLYPAAWSFSRKTIDEDVLDDGTVIPAGSTVVTAPYIIQRHPDFWHNPEGFDPARFLKSDDKLQQHPFAFFPFAAGKHVCLGNRFAMLEGVIILSSLVRAGEYHLLPGTHVEAEPAMTLRPKAPLLMTVHPQQKIDQKKQAGAA